jgi:RimJ/RimL family protein N-acetyltransferase
MTPNAPITIRPAGADDARGMLAFLDDLVAERPDTISLRTTPSLQDQRDRLDRVRFTDRAMILLALEGRQVIGMLEIWGGERADNRHAGRLGMSVAADRRGRGVGRRLLSGAIEEARGWPGFCRIELECAPWNAPAIALYEHLGFRHEGRMIKALNLRGTPEDMLLMALTW